MFDFKYLIVKSCFTCLCVCVLTLSIVLIYMVPFYSALFYLLNDYFVMFLYDRD